MYGRRYIQTIRLDNILSYGPNTKAFHLEPLNVLIGRNASGKSNFLETLSILSNAPKDIQAPFREGGGVYEWFWKGPVRNPFATIEVTVENQLRLSPPVPLRYRLTFSHLTGQFTVNDEVVEDEHSSTSGCQPEPHYSRAHGESVFNHRDSESPHLYSMHDPSIKADQSILSQRIEPRLYPELGYLGEVFRNIRFLGEIHPGPKSPLRFPQQTDLPTEYLLQDGSNLFLVLKTLLNQPDHKEWIFENLQEFFPEFQDIRTESVGQREQVFFQERGLSANISTARLSDGTLRFLCLLAVLCSTRLNPTPPLLFCIEEPEMGLHPDVIPKLAKLLVEASERSQVFVTTHSDILVDALTETPEAVVICEKVEGATQLSRLDRDDLKVWLEKYRLGELWTSGQLGGNLY